MGQTRTITISRGKGYQAHNARLFRAYNVDSARTVNNITYVHKTHEEAYEEIFGDAVAKYDENQHRKNRQYGSAGGYLQKIVDSKNGEQPSWELIVQVGDMLDCACGTPDGDMAMEVLDEYARAFQSRNPNLHVIGMYLHLDESTPHLHIDVVPVADDYTTGLSKRNSWDRALKLQGINAGANNKKSNATIVWQDAERDALEAIMVRYGLERAELSGSKRNGLSIDQYRLVMERLSAMVHEIELPQMPEKARGKVRVSVEELYNMRVCRGLLEKIDQEASAEIKAMKVARKRLAEREVAAENVLAELADLKKQVPALQNQVSVLSEKYADIDAINKRLQGDLIATCSVLRAVRELWLLSADASAALDAVIAMAAESLRSVSIEAPVKGDYAPLVHDIAALIVRAGDTIKWRNGSIVYEPPGCRPIELASGVRTEAEVRQLIGDTPIDIPPSVSSVRRPEPPMSVRAIMDRNEREKAKKKRSLVHEKSAGIR